MVSSKLVPILVLFSAADCKAGGRGFKQQKKFSYLYFKLHLNKDIRVIGFIYHVKK